MDARESAGPRMERRIVSVLFADLVGFTALSEALDAEDVAAVQDAYFAGIRDAVTRHGGRLEKFIGDAAVAAFGADRTREDDAERAVRAGLAIVALVSSLGARLGLDEDALDVRVGVQTGEVAVATDGPDAGRLTGDTMNTAARFQAAAAPGTVLCGRPTVLAAAHAIGFGTLTPFTLKGKAEPALAAVAEGPLPEASRAAAMGELRAATVGRQAELATLAAAWARVADGGTERWTVLADPGVGKSRLLAEVRTRAEARGAVPWAARLRAGEVTPFAAVGALIRAALGVDPDPLARLIASGVEPERAAVLAAEVPGLLAGSVGAPGAGSDLAAERSTRFRSWLALLDALAAGRPQLWLVEDVHWAGGDLLAFLALAGATPTPAGRLVLATARPQLAEAVPDWPDIEGGRLLELGPLAGGDAGSLVRALVGEAVPDHLVDAITARADGNPLFIEELLRSWVSLGVLVRDGGEWRVTVEPAGVPMPETVQALYAAQLDDLPPAAREVARRASVAGRRFAERALSELGLAPGPVREGLALLLRGSLVEGPRDDATTGPGYGYRHALLRDAGYASLARAERLRLHLAIARWMAALPGALDALAEPIGRQLAAAAASISTVAVSGPPGQDRVTIRDEAAGWLANAADRAAALAAHDAAAALLRESITLTDPQASLAIARRTARLGEVLAWAKSTDQAESVLTDARTRLGALLEGPDSAAARTGYAAATMTAIRLELERLRFRDGIAMADAALALLGDPAPDADAAAARIHVARGTAIVFQTNRGDAALEVAQRVQALARRTDDPELELDGLRLEIVAAGESGEAVGGLLDRQVELIRALGRTHLLPTTLFNRAMVRLGERTGEMPALLDEADREARAQGQIHVQAWVRMGRAEMGLLTGAWDDAMRWGRAALDLAIPNALHRVAVRTWFVLAPIAAYRGEVDLLRELGAWLRARTDLPDSPYGRLMHAALDHLVAAGTGADPVTPDADRLLEAWALPYDDAGWVAARDAVLRAWWDAGRFEELTAALDAIPLDPDGAPFATGAVLLWRARMGEDEGSVVGQAREALRLVRRWDAAWWIEQAIGVLDDAGDATPDEREERRIIRLRLLGMPPV